MPPDLLNDEMTLLQAVLHEPDADGPRLRYAEYLNSLTAPAEQARGEFIRLQIDLSRATNEHPHWAMMIGRQRELLSTHRTTWERPLRRRCRPKTSVPTQWLKAKLFGSGGVWGYHRGFVDRVLAPAERFLREDIALLEVTPLRQVALTHPNDVLGELANEPRIKRVESLYLIGEMEIDDDLQILSRRASDAGFTLVDFRYPRLRNVFQDTVFSEPTSSDQARANETNTQWLKLASDPHERLNRLLSSPQLRILFDEPAPEHTPAVLALSDWVFMGNQLRKAGVWAVAKSYQDQLDEEGRCRRLLLLREQPTAELLASPFFHSVVG